MNTVTLCSLATLFNNSQENKAISQLDNEAPPLKFTDQIKPAVYWPTLDRPYCVIRVCQRRIAIVDIAFAILLPAILPTIDNNNS